MATKVNKGEIFQLKNQMDQKVSQTEIEKSEEKMESKIQNFDDKVKRLLK